MHIASTVVDLVTVGSALSSADNILKSKDLSYLVILFFTIWYPHFSCADSSKILDENKGAIYPPTDFIEFIWACF